MDESIKMNVMHPEKKLFTILAIFFMIYSGFSCTKLDTPVYDQVEHFWRTPEEVAAGVAPAYTGLRNYAPGFGVYIMSETCTDEIIVPNRITDWGDDASWEQLWKHTWDATFQDGDFTWGYIYGGISGINGILETVGQLNPAPANLASIQAELKTVRAFYYFQGIDLFGNIPIVENNHVPLSALATKARKDVFDYTEKEIKDNLNALSAAMDGTTYGRATQWFSRALLAKLYINAGVFTGTTRWQDCIDACDSILNSNLFTLENNFFDNFKVENQNSKESIFSIPFDIQAGLNGFYIQVATLHYYSSNTFGLSGGGVNGFCSTEEYYQIFNPNDYRRRMFLVGQQYLGSVQYADQVPNPANAQTDRLGNPLNFDPVMNTFTIQQPKTESAGARCVKWELNKNSPNGTMDNDFAVFRLADIILMKAEAQMMLGDNAGALATINMKINGVSIRSRANMPDFNIAELNPDGILAERARELSWEGWRRNDMIRLGHFTDSRNPEKLVSADFRKLFPIPQPEMQKNQYLVQNPGY